MSAAIDAIKERHGIQKISVAGFSGGGHVVASLLTMRSDVECAVPASANSAPKMRWTMRGLTQDLTGYSDSFEPGEHLSAALAATGVRVFVLGDLNDMNVPWSTQLVLAKRLKQLGVAVEELEGEGTGPARHDLAGSSTLIGSMCMKGATTQEILERVKQGLKG